MGLPVEPETPIVVIRGDRKRVVFRLVSGETAVSWSGFGTEYAARVRRRPSDGDQYADFEIDDTDAETGDLVAKLTAEQTRALPSGVYLYDVQASNDDGPITVFRGPLTVKDDVTP